MASFIAESTSVGDGCVKNIATKFSSLLYQSMMPDKFSALLYNFYINEFLVPIGQLPTSHVGDVNHGGDKTGDAILLNEVVNAQYLNFAAFIKKITAEVAIEENLSMVKRQIFAQLMNDEVKEYIATLDAKEAEKMINECFANALESDEIHEKYGYQKYDKLTLLAVCYLCAELFFEEGLRERPEVQAFLDSSEEFRSDLIAQFKLIAVKGIEPSPSSAPEVSEAAGIYNSSDIQKFSGV